MDKNKLLALMYDFYNSHTLISQNDDISYYINQIKENNAKNVLIIGAGTGRVAIPLSDYSNVSALDFDKERLERLKEKKENIKTLCMDFLDYIGQEKFDLIIIPYSTLQFNNDEYKLNAFFKKLNEIMDNSTILIFDVSESFNSKVEKNRDFLFKDYCNEVDDIVEVFYTSRRHKKYIEFIVEYVLNSNKITVTEIEKYYYYDKKVLLNVIENNNLEIIRINDGYGKDGFKHKHLYHCRRKH